MKNSGKLISLIMAVAILFTMAAGMEFSAMAQICGDYEYIVLEDGTAEITKYNGNVSDLTVPQELDGYSVSSIGEEAFKNNLYIRRLTILDNIDRVRKMAFYAVNNLQFLNLPEKNIDYGNEVFRSCNNLTSVVIPEGVTRISAMMFYRCEGLREISFPSTLKEIGGRAFDQCGLIQSIKLPDGLERIDGAFHDCSSLTDITLPSSLTYLGSGTFEKCVLLKNITIPNGITQIESDLFKGCTNLETVSIPEGVTKIESSAFEDCIKIKNIALPNSLKTIEYNAFKNCSSLQNLVIPENVSEIFKGAFQNDISLMNITIPNRVAVIDKDTFIGCDNLQSITIMGEFCRIINGAIPSDTIIICSENSEAAHYAEANGYKTVYFEEAEDYDFSISEEMVRIEKYNGNKEDLVVLSKLSNYPVTVIGKSAFRNNAMLKSIILPNSLKTIESSAFSGCESLTAIQIPSGVISIESDAFKDCNSMNELFFPQNIDIENTSVSENTTKVSYILNDRDEIVITSVNLGGNKSSIIIPDVIADKRVAEVAENVDKSVISKEGHTHDYYNCECLICSEISHSDVEHHDFVEPNCISAGNIEYYFCWTCRKYFSDESYENIISYDSIELKPTGHKFTNYVYNDDATYEKDGTETAVCDECGFKDTRVKSGTKLEKPIATDPSTEKPSETPSDTEKPTEKPSDTEKPTDKPSEKPSEKPSDIEKPTNEPTEKPSDTQEPTDKPSDSQKPTNDTSDLEYSTGVTEKPSNEPSENSTVKDEGTIRNPNEESTTAKINSSLNKEESTTVPVYPYNNSAVDNNNYYPVPDSKNIIDDNYTPVDNYNDYRPSQSYQETETTGESDITITIHITERALLLIIILVVVIFIGIIIVLIVKRKRDY